MLVTGRACHPVISELMKKIGRITGYNAPPNPFNGNELPQAQVADIRKYRQDGYSVTAIAEKVRVSRQTVYKYL